MPFSHKTFTMIRKAHVGRNFDSMFVFTITYGLTGTPVSGSVKQIIIKDGIVENDDCLFQWPIFDDDTEEVFSSHHIKDISTLRKLWMLATTNKIPFIPIPLKEFGYAH